MTIARSAPVRRGPVIALVGVLVGLGAAACGSASVHPSPPAVVLELTTRPDAGPTSAARLVLTGSVRPHSATVQVLGQRVTVSASGRFRAGVALAVGANLIDVIASAPHSPGAVVVVRTTRFLLVSVPDVSGEDPTSATAALRALGLTPRVRSSSGPFSFLLPISVQVCGSTPDAGTRVDPGAVVTLQVAKLCGL